MRRCLGIDMMGYIVRRVSDSLVIYVSNIGNKLSIGFVNIGVG